MINLKKIRFLTCCTLIFWLTLLNDSFSQKFVTVYKNEYKKVLTIQTGDQITFQLHNNEQWFTRTIYSIHSESNMLSLGNWDIFLDSISTVRARPKKLLNFLGKNFLILGFSGIIYNIVEVIKDTPYWKENFVITSSISALGYGMQKIPQKGKKYNIGKKFQVMIIDTNFYPTKS